MATRSKQLVALSQKLGQLEIEVDQADRVIAKARNKVKAAQLELEALVASTSGVRTRYADVLKKIEALAKGASTPVAIDPMMLRQIDGLELTVRGHNCLKASGIYLIGDLVTKTEAELLKIDGFGQKHLREVQDRLAGRGLKLGMAVLDWPPVNRDQL